MTRTTNAIQRNYMTAKALVDTLEAQEEEIEREYIQAHNITNKDGEILTHIWCIDDEDAFNSANAEVGKIEVVSGLQDNINVARDALEIAEAKLIKYGLALAPVHERKVLEAKCFGLGDDYVHVDIRQKVIDLVLRLDVSTVHA